MGAHQQSKAWPVGRRTCVPPPNSAFPQAWEKLEKAEHERELALRNELIRQEKLEQLARRFDRKAAMREAWLSENQRLVAQVGPASTTAGTGAPRHCLTAGFAPSRITLATT